MDRSDTRKQVQSLGSRNIKPNDDDVKMSGREGADPVDPSSISEDQEETGPAHKVEHGRKEPKGMTPRASGSIIGTGEETEGMPREGTVMSSSSRGKEPSAGGSTMGHANAKHGMTGPKSF